MKSQKQKCPVSPIKISPKRKIIFTDEKKFPWRADSKGYFLVKIKDGKIHCGFANKKHEVKIEFVGSDVEKMIKEIAKRKICDMGHMGYIASELMIAKDYLKNRKKYAQR